MVHHLRAESDELPMVLWSLKTENGGNQRKEGIVSWNPASGDELEVEPHFCFSAASVPKEDKVVAAILDVAISGNRGSTPRYYPKRHNSNDAVILPLSPDERERKVATLAEGKRKVGAHQRPLTLDGGANRDGSEGEGVSNKIEDTAGIVNVANGFAREHAAEGWASWLVSVAGEAVKGWLPRRANSFEKLNKA